LAQDCRSENDLSVLSIFVNPTQFGPNEDFERYPRDLEHDRGLASEYGVDLLFVPAMESMYRGGPEAQRVWVDPGPLAMQLEGASRPGHFRGVTTIVAKLLHMAQPDRVYFGQKDGQQAAIVLRMVEDLAFPIEVRIVPTERESDGLALSSRNVYLSVEERKQAGALWHALRAAGDAIVGGLRNPRALQKIMEQVVEREAPLGRLDYATVSDLASLKALEGPLERDALISLAVYFKTTRLIDNIMVRFDRGLPHYS
jgi:pantoate--beta-alanine ligase